MDTIPGFPGDDMPDLGPCCACGRDDRSVRNLLCLPYRVDWDGGWGCLQCDVSAHGAVAVVCDACLAANAELKFAIKGFATGKKRVPIEAVKSFASWHHDLAKHPESVEHLSRGRA